MKQELLSQLQTLRQAGRPVALVTALEGGEQTLVTKDTAEGQLSLEDTVLSQVRSRLEADVSARLEDGNLFVRIYSPPLRLILIGAVHISQALIPLATLTGYQVTVIDPRNAFASDARFPNVLLIDSWPDEAMRQLAPDQRTAVVTLTHDPKLDDPALTVALRSDAFYIGSLGSRKTHAARVERLTQAGFSTAELERIHAPVGLHLGGKRPAEIALSVMAEITQVLRLGTTR